MLYRKENNSLILPKWQGADIPKTGASCARFQISDKSSNNPFFAEYRHCQNKPVLLLMPITNPILSQCRIKRNYYTLKQMNTYSLQRVGHSTRACGKWVRSPNKTLIYYILKGRGILNRQWRPVIFLKCLFYPTIFSLITILLAMGVEPSPLSNLPL